MAKRATRKKPDKEIELPTKFVPQFWNNSDGRISVVRIIRQRYEELKADCGANSVQKDILCQRATFVCIQLETMEVEATKTGKFSSGKYTQMLNTLMGLLRTLGLERQAKQVECLESYVIEKKKKRKKNGKRKKV